MKKLLFMMLSFLALCFTNCTENGVSGTKVGYITSFSYAGIFLRVMKVI